MTRTMPEQVRGGNYAFYREIGNAKRIIRYNPAVVNNDYIPRFAAFILKGVKINPTIRNQSCGIGISCDIDSKFTRRLNRKTYSGVPRKVGVGYLVADGGGLF